MAHKVLQLKIPKTASSSIEEALNRMNKRNLINKIRSFGHGIPKNIVKNLGDLKYNNAVVLASVRNPYDRLLSGYKYIVERKKDKPEHQWVINCSDFNDFCRKISQVKNFLTGRCRFYHLQKDWLILNKKVSYDFLIRYETLVEDWNRFVKKFTNKTIPLPIIRKSNHDHWKSVYDSKSRDIVYQIYKDDFQLLDYSKKI